MKKLLLLSFVVLAACSLTTITVSAKAIDKKVQGSTTCNKCHKEMGNESHHCKCAHEVCVKPVQALEHAPLKKVCSNKDRCPEGTTMETNKHGKTVCIEKRVQKVEHPLICDTTCDWACPTGYEEEEMTPGHVVGKVNDNRHEARERRMSKRAMKNADMMTEKN